MTHARTREKQIIDACVRALRTVDGIATAQARKDVKAEQANGPVDALITIRGQWGTCKYLAEVKNQLTPATLQIATHQLRRLQRRNFHQLLLTEFIPQNLADELKRQKLEFVDTAGNVYLNHPPLYVEITGRKRPLKPNTPDRAFRPAGLKLIYVLLKNPELVGTNYRDLAKRAGIAVGAVGILLDNLRQLGFIRRIKPGEQELANQRDLVDRWTLAYNETLRPRLAVGTHRFAGRAIEDLMKAAGPGDRRDVLIGGELGAGVLTKHLRPERATLHLAGDLNRALALLRLLPDPKGNVDLVRTFGTDNAYDKRRPALVDPLLVRAELLRAPGERIREIADDLFEKHIGPRLQ